MMSLTLRRSTANWMAESALRSECTTTLATLRCTKTSPGSSPVIWLAGTRLSEQPIHIYLGVCCFTRLVKKPGRSASICAAQARLWAKRSWRDAVMVVFSPAGGDAAAEGAEKRRGSQLSSSVLGFNSAFSLTHFSVKAAVACSFSAWLDGVGL